MHRKLMRLSRLQVAEILQLHNTEPLSAWEKGTKFPSTINLINLSIIYRTYPNELYPEYFSQQIKLLRQKEQEVL